MPRFIYMVDVAEGLGRDNHFNPSLKPLKGPAVLSAAIDPEAEATTAHGISRRPLSTVVKVTAVALALVSFLFVAAIVVSTDGLPLVGSDGEPATAKCLVRLRAAAETSEQPNCSFDSLPDSASSWRDYELADGVHQDVGDGPDVGCGGAAVLPKGLQTQESAHGSCS
ncbi:MAG: hypothetical protein GY724_03220 [Actinomycetia bacterium]|nr:hypothetical protein [Actinomycetes bacterium]MCP4226124.1 hypothetical protein [Actinomycetes bacterium]MCP5032995.1 hypothetical protein [Actinomycetes bacterium]